MGCGMSYTPELSVPMINQHELPPIRSDILANVGIGSIHELVNKHNEPVFNSERQHHLENIDYCHVCRAKGIYYIGRLFIDSEQTFRNRIKYICAYHLKKKKVYNSLW